MHFMTTVTSDKLCPDNYPKKIRETLGIKEGIILIIYQNKKKIIMRKTGRKLKEYSNFLSPDFDNVHRIIRKDSRERLKTLGIIQ